MHQELSQSEIIYVWTLISNLTNDRAIQLQRNYCKYGWHLKLAGHDLLCLAWAR